MEICLVEILSSLRNGRGFSHLAPYAWGWAGNAAACMEVK